MKIKHTIHIILAAVFIAQAMNNLVVLASFKINQSYLEKHACINRDKPASKCYAHCQLKKQLSKGQKANEFPLKLKEAPEWLAYCGRQEFHLCRQSDGSIAFSSTDEGIHMYGSVAAPFHPPEANNWIHLLPIIKS